MSNKYTYLFDDEDIIEKSSYKTAVYPEAFLEKVEELCVYTQDFSWIEAVDLEKAEQIIMFIKALYR